MSLFSSFIHFYNQIVERSPELTLEQVVRKFVRAKTLHPSLPLRFGLELNLEVNNLTRMPDVVHSFSEKCAKLIGNDGKEYLFLVEKPNEQVSNLLEKLIGLNKILTDADFVNSAPPGSYTFMIGSTSEGIPHLYAMRAFTYHEIGTKHCQILERITSEAFGPGRMSVLHYAGEMFVRVRRDGERAIDFNFSSGTYMRGQTDPELEKTTYEPEIVKLLESFVQPGKNVRIKLGAKLLISGIVTPREAIWMYLIAEMKILIFKSEQECARYTKAERAEQNQFSPKRKIESLNDELIRDIPPPKINTKKPKRLFVRPRTAPKVNTVMKKKNTRQAQPLKLGVVQLQIGTCPDVPTQPMAKQTQ